MKVISDKDIPLVVKTTALRCFVTVTQVMIQFPPHQVSLVFNKNVHTCNVLCSDLWIACILIHL